MLSLLNVFAGKKNLNAVLKGVIALVFFSFCGLELLAQPPCNNLSVSLGPNVEYCNGASITLTATITGGPNGLTPIYTWVFDSDTGGFVREASGRRRAVDCSAERRRPHPCSGWRERSTVEAGESAGSTVQRGGGEPTVYWQ